MTLLRSLVLLYVSKTLYHFHRLVTNMIGCVLVLHMHASVTLCVGLHPRLAVQSSLLCLQMKTLCRTLQERGTGEEYQLHYMGCNHKCTPASNATHSSSGFTLFSVAISTTSTSVSTVGPTHQQFHVTILDTNCQFVAKTEAHYVSYTSCLSSLCKRVKAGLEWRHKAEAIGSVRSGYPIESAAALGFRHAFFAVHRA